MNYCGKNQDPSNVYRNITHEEWVNAIALAVEQGDLGEFKELFESKRGWSLDGNGKTFLYRLICRPKAVSILEFLMKEIPDEIEEMLHETMQQICFPSDTSGLGEFSKFSEFLFTHRHSEEFEPYEDMREYLKQSGLLSKLQNS